MTKQTSATPEYRPFLTRIEALRGLCVLAVAGYHLASCKLNGVALFPYSPWEPASPIQHAIGRAALVLVPGHAAAVMFFVISGYVLRLSLAFGPQSFGLVTWTFVIRRLFRIYPMVFAGTIVFLVLTHWHLIKPKAESIEALGLRKIVANFLLLDISVNNTLWTLQVEMLMIPFILLFYFLERRFGIRPLVGIALATTALSFHGGWAFYGPLSHYFFAFALGMLIPTVGRDLFRQASQATVRRSVIVAVLALVLPGVFFGLYSRFSTIIQAYGATILISILSFRNDVSGLRVLDTWGVRKLGLISGSYYVLQLALFPFVLLVLEALIPASWSLQAPFLLGLILVPVCLLAIAPVMWLSYRAIEAPGTALGHRIARKPGVKTVVVSGSTVLDPGPP